MHADAMLQEWAAFADGNTSRSHARELLHGAQHHCCFSEPKEEQLDVFTPGATVITVLGDSLSSTEARCNAVFPWPMLLQDALGREQFTVHGFALPGVHAQNYADTDVWTRAITTTPDILAIMLGTNDGHDDFRGEKFRGWIQRLLAGFDMPRGRVILIAPPPLWKDRVFTNMRKHVINDLIPPIVGDEAHKIGARFINMKARMLEAGFTSAISCDGCHLYPEGQTFMMQQVLDTVRSMMTPPPSPSPPSPPAPPPPPLARASRSDKRTRLRPAICSARAWRMASSGSLATTLRRGTMRPTTSDTGAASAQHAISLTNTFRCTGGPLVQKRSTRSMSDYSQSGRSGDGSTPPSFHR